MSFELIFFFVLGVLGIASAVGVILFRNPIASAMSLVVHFISLAGLYLSLNALFMAAIQVLIYAGAIMVLVVFVIMLLNLGHEEKVRERLFSRQTFGVLLTMLFGGGLIYVLSRVIYGGGSGAAPVGGMESGSVQAIGKALFTEYVYPFEMVSLILLAAVVGAVVLAKAKVD
jgi:NADH-quinone oxidoreductase subunit J